MKSGGPSTDGSRSHPVVPFPRRQDIVERVLLQFQAFLSDPIFRDNLPLRVQVFLRV